MKIKLSERVQSHFSKNGTLVSQQYLDTSRMFDVITKTWNPIVGCLHSCSYCWAKRLVDTRLKNSGRYRDGFSPKSIEKELKKKFCKQFVFVSDMGDLFGDWVPEEWILKVMEAIRKSPSSMFLFLTKNPRRYGDFVGVFPKNVVLGATLESNREYQVSKAPSVLQRYESMERLHFDKKLVCIEPIMDFDLEIFVEWLHKIKPSIVYVGYDNYGNKLPEPSNTKTDQLINQLSVFTRVRTKF